MTISHNMNGMKAYRGLAKSQSKVAGDLKKLSSGYAINSAADDAAGLSISELMRLQITGLDRAAQNAREGIALIQTGEAALQEVHNMLDRLAELADQSANGTYNDTLDRAALQREVDQISDEIGRIADSANFNGIELFQNAGYVYEEGLVIDTFTRTETTTTVVQDLKSTAGAEAKITTVTNSSATTRKGVRAPEDAETTARTMKKTGEVKTDRSRNVTTIVETPDAQGNRTRVTTREGTDSTSTETESVYSFPKPDLWERNISGAEESAADSFGETREEVRESTVNLFGVTETYGVEEAPALTLGGLLADDSPTLKNIVFLDEYDFTTATTPSNPVAYSGADATLANTLKTEIVPQIVQGILSKYTAFSYLNGSSIGIGLDLYRADYMQL